MLAVIFVVSLGIFAPVAIDATFNYDRLVRFVFYNEHSEPVFNLPDQRPPPNATNCNRPDGKLSVIVHGWHEGCYTQWVPLLVKNLNAHRGGCIVCMDYSEYARYSYLNLLGHFDGLAEGLTARLLLFRDSFAARRTFMFGFSFGGQLVLFAGQKYAIAAGEQLHQIDACEPAGPGFDRNATFQRLNRPMAAAQNVQCVHTSYDKGTALRACHQNWNLGRCGWTQTAASGPPFGSHGLCPYMYVASFGERFPAIERPAECPASQRGETPPNLLGGLSMGYNETRTSAIQGEFYANTFRCSPYNRPCAADEIDAPSIITSSAI